MNLVILEEADFTAPGLAAIGGRRRTHLLQVLGAGVGDAVSVGVLGGNLGRGRIAQIDPEVVLECVLDQAPPPRSPVDLLLAVPRPKILRRVLQAAASMGVGQLVLLGSYRVEKSYFQSPLLSSHSLREQLILGLEQAADTRLPEIQIRRLFKPFMEDELEAQFSGHQRKMAHPRASTPLGPLDARRALIAIGPEGGWTEYEAQLLERNAFVPWSLGRRILRVDVAVPWAVAQVDLAHPLAATPPGAPIGAARG